jgi:hypothetical protein
MCYTEIRPTPARQPRARNAMRSIRLSLTAKSANYLVVFFFLQKINV